MTKLKKVAPKKAPKKVAPKKGETPKSNIEFSDVQLTAIESMIKRAVSDATAKFKKKDFSGLIDPEIESAHLESVEKAGVINKK